MTAPNINMFLAGLLIDELVRRGIKIFCISPGSRSTPLTVAAAMHPDARTRVHIDERASAYYAVGYARATGYAAAVICTSGTAGGNMYPAVIEAYQSRLPLLILTADRPEELQNVGANQTINQENLFGRYTPVSLTIPAPSNDFAPADFLDKLNDAFRKAAAEPLHINCRFREPLAPIQHSFDSDRMQRQVEQWRNRQDANNRHNPEPLPQKKFPEILSSVEKASGGLIIAGPEAPFRSSRMVGKLSKKLGWPIMADILSQARNNEEGYIPAHYDLILGIDAMGDSLRPDLVIHIGGLPTSKRLNRFLQTCKGVRYIKIQSHNRTIDPDRLETERIIGQPDVIIGKLLERLKDRDRSEYCRRWMDIENRCAAFLEDYFSRCGLTEPSLAYRIGQLLPGSHSLYLSSSMPVRDADTFVSFGKEKNMIGANRGASGIDGVIASACGFAYGGGRATTLLVGDLAFLHDLNSLAIAEKSEIPIIIIVINNNGGGIFHFLPVARSVEDFEKYFAAPHGLNFNNAAALFNLAYYQPKTIGEFDDNYRQAISLGKSAVIEITGHREQNAGEHRDLMSRLENLLTP